MRGTRPVSRVRRAGALVLGLLLLTGALHARGEEQPAPSSYEIQVKLVMIDVVVTDEDGRHVTDLSADDFELLEDGEPQTITDFSEEGRGMLASAAAPDGAASSEAPGEAAAAPALPRQFIFFFDESRMTPNHLGRACAAAREFATTLRSGDASAVLRYGKSLRLEQDFTSDPAALLAALQCEGFRGDTGSQDYPGQEAPFLRQRPRPAPGGGLGGSLGSGPPPRSGPPSQRPTSGSDVSGGAGGGGEDPATPLSRLQDLTINERRQELAAAERLYESLALVARSLESRRGRKTLVLFSTGFDALFTGDRLPHGYRTMVDACNRANVAIYAIDPAGGSASAPGDVRASYNYLTGILPPTQAFLGRGREKTGWLKSVAGDTGGEALVLGNDLAAQLARMAESTSHYYLLGYVPTDDSKPGFRDVRVDVRRPGVRVLARKGYIRRKPFFELSERERRQQLEEALDTWTDLDEVPFTLRTEFYPSGTRHAVVGMEVEIDPAVLTAGSGGAEVELLLRIARAGGGRKAAERHEVIPIDLGTPGPRRLHFLEGVELKSGQYVLRAALRDNKRGTLGTHRTAFRIPEFDKKAPTMSSLVLMKPASTDATRLARGTGPAVFGFNIGEDGFVPAGTTIPRTLGEVVCHLRVANLEVDDATGGPRLVLGYALLHDGEVVAQQVAPYVPNGPMDPEIGVPVHFRLPVGALAAGTYTILVQARDELAPAKAVRGEVTIDVVDP